MFGFNFFGRRARPVLLRVLSTGLLGLIAAGVTPAMVATAATVKRNLPVRPIGKPDPDVLLIGIYKDLGANHLRQAESKAEALVAAYPNFSLGHLIQGDLLLMHTRPITGLGTASNASAEKLTDLREEAMVRLKALRERPDPELIPRALLKLRDDQRYALIADTKRSRLYVYQHLHGQLKLLSDYYITQGKLGIHKIKEGDQKTPIGVYYITSRLARTRLPDFYGAGALPINYPNEWDRLNGRSGSGIWLHGTPSTSYSRPPLASDGCVVLTNPDLEKLFNAVNVGITPVVISEHAEFTTKKQWLADRDAATHLLDNWRRDLESMNTAQFLKNYAPSFKSAQGEDLASWSAKHAQSMAGIQSVNVKLQDETIFAYPDRQDLIVATFTQNSMIGKHAHQQRKRQYWLNAGGTWKIVYEGNL